jgi:hypothetical protein
MTSAVKGDLLQLFCAERQRERDDCVRDVLAEPDSEPDMSWEVREALAEAKRRIIERMRRRQ